MPITQPNTTMTIYLSRFAAYKQWCYDHHVGYGMGHKCQNPGMFPPVFADNLVDCSGFVRAILAYATMDATSSMPDGSFLEDDWFGHQGFQRIDYKDCGLNDKTLRVAIHKPGGRGGDAVGHIWLCVHGHTVESYGGHGPGERPWNLPLLLDIVDDCYVLGAFI